MILNLFILIILKTHTHKTTHFPYTTLFRSHQAGREDRRLVRASQGRLADGPGRLLLKRECSGSGRSEEHTSELQSQFHLVCRLLLEKKKYTKYLYSN